MTELAHVGRELGLPPQPVRARLASDG
jgi:hypothetical protein